MMHQDRHDQMLTGQGKQPIQEEYRLSSLGASSSAAKKTYNMYYTTSRTNAKLHLGSSSGPCIYYAELCVITPKPRLHLRLGDSKAAPMVAFTRFHRTSRHLLLGLGDCDKGPEEKLVLEEMRRERFILVRSDYEFETSIGSGPRKTYGWRRDTKQGCSKTVYSCVDEEGKVVSTLLSGGFFNWKKGGEIEIIEDLDKDLESLLVVSALAIWCAEAGWSSNRAYETSAEKHTNADPYKQL